MRRRDKLKQTGVLKTNGSLMNKIFKVYMLLMFVSCVVLMVVFGIRFSSVYNSQARSHMNDVTVAAETGLEERISQIDQLSVSILINNSVQKNLKEINYQTLVNPENTSFQTEKAAIYIKLRNYRYGKLITSSLCTGIFSGGSKDGWKNLSCRINGF